MTEVKQHSKYDKWIVHNRLDNPYVSYTKCSETTELMVKSFPELLRVCGLVKGKNRYGDIESYPHWWCETESEDIVDPTVSQFHNLENLQYSKATETPTGRCPNCGELCYNNNYLCTPKCEKQYHDYIMGVRI